MAGVKYSGIVQELKGSIAGSTFQSRKNGFSVRSKPVPPKTRSYQQSRARQVITQVSQAWRNLTQGERDAWEAAAPSWPHTDKFGDPVTLSGYNLWILLGMNLAICGLSPIAAASTPATLFTIVTASAVADVSLGSIVLTFDPTPEANACYIVAAASAPLSPGRNYSLSKMRIVEVFGPATASPQDITSNYVKIFGAFPPVGQKVLFDLWMISSVNGTTGPRMSFSSIVIP